MNRRYDYTTAPEMFQKEFMSCAQIAAALGGTRQTVQQYLRKNGIDTRRKKIEIRCDWCLKTIERPKCRVRNQKHHFCGTDCRMNFMGTEEFKREREETRLAKIAMEDACGFLGEFVIHFIDGNRENRKLKNLIAFKTESDRQHWLHGGIVLAMTGKAREWKEITGR